MYLKYVILDDKFSSETLSLYLNFIKFEVEKADSYIQTILNIFKCFLIINFSIHSQILNLKI